MLALISFQHEAWFIQFRLEFPSIPPTPLVFYILMLISLTHTSHMDPIQSKLCVAHSMVNYHIAEFTIFESFFYNIKKTYSDKNMYQR